MCCAITGSESFLGIIFISYSRVCSPIFSPISWVNPKPCNRAKVLWNPFCGYHTDFFKEIIAVLMFVHFSQITFFNRQLFQDGQNPMFNSILLHLGFVLPEQWDENSVIIFPEADYEVIKSVISFLDTLIGNFMLLLSCF